MKAKPFFTAIIFFIVSSCENEDDTGNKEPNNMSEVSYSDEINNHRKAKDAMFEGNNSPLSDSLKSNFKGLNYFPIDTAYRLFATFEKIKDGKIFTMPSTGLISDYYQIAGKIYFSFNGDQFVLEAYENQSVKTEGYNMYFVPFFDLTNGNKSYNGGRYLDIPEVKSGKIILDFNYAYNPYCVYNHAYSCPIPPPENSLSCSIKAGEKMF